MDILENAKPENCFFCIDGSVLRNILDLEQKLRTISNRAFYHHVSQSKNDFHNWVRDVFQDYELANQVLRAKTPAAAAAAVRRHIRKTFLAEDEIESAIRKVVEQKPAARKAAKISAAAAKATAAKKAKEKKQRQQKSKHRKKNRKLNKMTFLRRRSHGSRKSKSSSRTFLAKKVHQKQNLPKKVYQKPSGKRRAKKKTKATADVVKKHIKKHVGQWLKWLSVNPKA